MIDYDPHFLIPRDFKLFLAGGRVWAIQVIDRNSKINGKFRNGFYDRSWKELEKPMKDDIVPMMPAARPPHFRRLIRYAEKISRNINGVFMRLDFYMTPCGPVFGEFTPTPADGWHFTEEASELFCKLMEVFPDSDLADWNENYKAYIARKIRNVCLHSRSRSLSPNKSRYLIIGKAANVL